MTKIQINGIHKFHKGYNHYIKTPSTNAKTSLHFKVREISHNQMSFWLFLFNPIQLTFETIAKIGHFLVLVQPYISPTINIILAFLFKVSERFNLSFCNNHSNLKASNIFGPNCDNSLSWTLRTSMFIIEFGGLS